MGWQDIFDMVDKGLEGLEKALKPAEADKKPAPKEPKEDDVEDAEFEDSPGPSEPIQRRQDWEAAWGSNIMWGFAKGKHGEGWHAFPEGNLMAFCHESFESHNVKDRQKLEPGKLIPACTGCIIGVSRHG